MSSSRACEHVRDAEMGETVEPVSIGFSSDADSSDDQELGALVPQSEASKPKQISIAPAQDEEPQCCGLSMKLVSLIALTLQTTGQVLLIKWARAETGKAPYISSTVVFFTEVVKTLASLCLVAFDAKDLATAGDSLREHFTKNKSEVFKAAVPALIYTIQNNLMFYSLEKLSAPVQQVLYQMKILTTAGLGVMMLGKKLTATQWSALFMLTTAVVMVQWPRPSATDSTLQSVEVDFMTSIGGDQVKGFIAVFVACLTSGFAAVYIQKMMQQTTCSIWMRNVQFGSFGALMALLVALGQDGAQIADDGFVQGYSLRVVLVILMNAFGGLLCAVMLKYAGATLGCFSTALSIILTCICSATLLQDFVPDALFLLGTFVAISACLLYGLGLPTRVYQAMERLFQPTEVCVKE